MIPCEKLEAAFIEAALNLAEQSQAHAFSLPVPNTTPRLFVALFEEGAVPPGVSAPSMPSSEWLAEAERLASVCRTHIATLEDHRALNAHLSKRVTAQVEPVRMLTQVELTAALDLTDTFDAIQANAIRAFCRVNAGKRIPADGEVRPTQAQGQDAAPAEQPQDDEPTWQELEDFRKRHWTHWNAADNLLIAHLAQKLKCAARAKE